MSSDELPPNTRKTKWEIEIEGIQKMFYEAEFVNSLMEIGFASNIKNSMLKDGNGDIGGTLDDYVMSIPEPWMSMELSAIKYNMTLSKKGIVAIKKKVLQLQEIELKLEKNIVDLKELVYEVEDSMKRCGDSSYDDSCEDV